MIIPLQFTKEVCDFLPLKLIKLKMVSLMFNLEQILPMNLKVVIVFKEQISKLFILAVNLLRHQEQKYETLIQRRQKHQISYDFQEKEKE